LAGIGRPSPDHDEIVERLTAGETAADLSRVFGKGVYYIEKELKKHKRSPDDKLDNEVDPFKLAEPSTRVRQMVPTKQQVQAKTPGARTAAGVSEIDKIRGVVGIYDQPKVLYMERPELLYIAMAMSLTYWGWNQMSTSDFIDTVLDDYIRASGKEYNVIIDTGRLGELVSFAKERGFNFWEEKPAEEKEKVKAETELPTEVVKLAEELEEQEKAESETERIEEESGDNEEEMETPESNVEEPHKPTVGDLLARLHISNIQKEVETNDSSETT